MFPLLFHIARLFSGNQWGEGPVTWGRFPRGCEGTVAPNYLLDKGGEGKCHRGGLPAIWSSFGAAPSFWMGYNELASLGAPISKGQFGGVTGREELGPGHEEMGIGCEEMGLGREEMGPH